MKQEHFICAAICLSEFQQREKKQQKLQRWMPQNDEIDILNTLPNKLRVFC